MIRRIVVYINIGLYVAFLFPISNEAVIPLALGWVMGRGGVYAGAVTIAFGFQRGIVYILNLRTGETCAANIACFRLGLGILVATGARIVGSIFGPKFGGSLGYGSGLGAGFNVRPGVGIGFFVGVDICVLDVISCQNTPCECKDEDCNCY